LNDTAATSIDATGLGGANSLKLAATVTASAATTATSDVTIKGSLGGADNITLKTVATTSKVLGNITVDDSANTSAGVTIDASSLASALDTGKALTIKSGSGADTIKVGNLAATITAGAGNDTITLAASHTSVETLAFAANSGTDTVNNWVVTKDILDGVSTTLLISNDLGNGWTVSGTGFASKSGATAADFVAAMQAATLANGVAAAKGVAAFNDGHNTWVVFTDGAATTTDSVIELVGVTGIAKLGTAASDTIGIA
jgi:S-layer protein